MTYDPNADRTYWRGQDDKRLIEAARDSGHELAIALGERLDDALAYAHAGIIEMQWRCDALRAELDDLHEALEAEMRQHSE